MKCLKPVSIRNPSWLNGDIYAPRWLLVPCGKCPHCLARRRSEWAFRLKEHAKKSNNAYFITLTYDNQFLPLDKNGVAHVSKRDCQNFMKRFRKYLNRFDKTQLSFYLCSEYGPETLRPHYHLLLFDLPQELCNDKMLYEVLMKTWKMGFVQCGTLADGGSAYVCKYVLHPIEDFPDFLTRPFSLMSKGIGAKFVTPEMVDYCYSQGTYILKRGKDIDIIPRYLRQKIFTKDELYEISKSIQENLSYEREKLFADDLEDYWNHPSRPATLSNQKLKTQADRIKKNLKSKHKLSKL